MNASISQGRLIRQRVSSLPHSTQLSGQKITTVISPWIQQTNLQPKYQQHEDMSLKHPNLMHMQQQYLNQQQQSLLSHLTNKQQPYSSEIIHKPIISSERSSPYQSTTNLSNIISTYQLRPRSNSQPSGVRLLSAFHHQYPPPPPQPPHHHHVSIGEFASASARFHKEEPANSINSFSQNVQHNNSNLSNKQIPYVITNNNNNIPQPLTVYRSKQQQQQQQQSTQILMGIASNNNSPQSIRVAQQQQSPFRGNNVVSQNSLLKVPQNNNNNSNMLLQYQQPQQNYFIPTSTLTLQPLSDIGMHLPFPPLPPQPTTGNSSLFRTASSKAPRKFDNSSLHFQYSHSPTAYPMGFEEATGMQKVVENYQAEQVRKTSVRSIDEFMGESFSEQEQVFGKLRLNNSNQKPNQVETRQSQSSQIYPSPFNISAIQPKGSLHNNSQNPPTNRFDDSQRNPILKSRQQSHSNINNNISGFDRLHSFSRDFQNFQMTSPNQSAVGMMQEQNDNGCGDSVIFEGNEYHPRSNQGYDGQSAEFRESSACLEEELQGVESVNMISQSLSYRQMFLTSQNGKNVDTHPVMHSVISEKEKFHSILQEKDKSIDNLKKQLEKAVQSKYSSNDKENRYNSMFEGYSSRSVNHQCDGWKIKVVDADESAKSKVILLEIELKNQKKVNEESMNQISLLHDQITQRNRQLEIQTLAQAHLEEAIADLTNQLRNKEKDIEIFMKEGVQSQKSSEQKSNSKTIEWQKYESLSQENLRLKAIVKDRDISLSESEQTIYQLNFQLEFIRSQSKNNSIAESQINLLQNEIAGFISSLNQASRDLEFANIALSEKQKEKELIQEDFERQMQEKEQEIAFLKNTGFGEERIAELSERIRTLEEEKILFQNEVSQFEVLHEKVTEQVQLLQNDNDSKDEENRKLTTELNTLKNSILDLESSILQVRRSKNVLESQLESLRAQERETCTLNEALQDNIQKRQVAFQQIENDCERLKMDNRLLQRSLGITDQQLEEQRLEQKPIRKSLFNSTSS